MTRGILTLWALLSIASGASRVRAFSDPERFSAATQEGGGGGRFFTGAPADSYTCAVCHRGGAAPQIGVAGLPRAGFGPGQVFEVELAFRGEHGNHSVALEVVDEWGRDLGLELLPEPQIAPAERCGAVQEGRRASYLTQIGDRRVLGVEACEARAVRFRFRTPQVGTALFVGTVLASDNSASIEGDGVTEIEQPLYADGRGPSDEASCSALPGRPGTRGGRWACMLGMLGVLAALSPWLRRKSRAAVSAPVEA